MMRSARRIASAFLPVTGAIPATRPPVSMVARPLSLPSAKVPLTTAPITTDGKLNEPGWTGATVIRLNHTASGDEIGTGTEARIMRDGTSLLIGFTCPKPTDNDAVSVLLSPSPRGLPYYRFSITRNGVTSDDRTGDTGWIGRWTGAVGITGDSWTAEITISISGMLTVPGDVTTWGANFARTTGPTDADTIVWAIPYGPVTTSDRFGALTF